MPINVLLVDDHKIIRDGLLAILAEVDDISVIGEAGSGKEALDKARLSKPDIVVMDLNLPDMGGMQATRRILAEFPGIRVLVLSMMLDEKCLFESLEAGVKGYLAKDCAGEELVAAIRAIYQDKPYFYGSSQKIMLKKYMTGATADTDSNVPVLTARETEVLKLIAKGLSTKEIAFELGLSVKMIEVHRMNVRKKLGLQSIAQLTTYALTNGLVAA